MSTKGKSLPNFSPVRKKKYLAMALTLAGVCCYGVWPALADDTNLIIGDTDTSSFSNDSGIHNISGNLILGNQTNGDGTYTITGDMVRTNVNFLSGGNGENPNGALIIGNGGTGSFTQGADDSSDSSTVNVAGDLVLGHLANSVGTYTLNSGSLTVGGQVAVGGQSTSDNTFTQNGGTLTLTNSASLSLDYASVGTGAWTGKLALGGGADSGGNDGGTGTYNMMAGFIDATANGIEIGNSGTGTMNQSGGEVQTNFLTQGFSGTGTYNLSGTGNIHSYSETVGYAGFGTFNQSGGTHTIDSELNVGLKVGENTEGQGTYTLTGGTLTSGNTFVGHGELGTFVLNNIDAPDPDTTATHTVNGNLILSALSIPASPGGSQTSGSGSYTITGNTSLDVNFIPGGNGLADPPFSNGWSDWDWENNIPNGEYGAPNGALIVGQSGNGFFTQGSAAGDDSPIVNVAGDLVLGSQAGSLGQYTLNTGNLIVGGKLVVGGASQSDNRFTQTGGTVDITNSASENPNDYVGVGNSYHNGALYVGGGGDAIIDGGTGTYLMQGGQLTTDGIEVGHAGVGVMTQSGNSTVDAGYILLGNASGYDGDGKYNLQGNSALNVNSIAISFGANGTFAMSDSSELTSSSVAVGLSNNVGVFNQSGGTHTTDALSLGQESDSIGKYLLTDGDLIVGGQMVVGHGDTNFSSVSDVNGLFKQSGGNVTANQIIIGGFLEYVYSGDDLTLISNYGTGRYELSGGTVLSGGTEVGSTSQGWVLQTGGTFDAGNLTLGNGGLFSQPDGLGGYKFYSSGIYDLEGGKLNTNGTTVAVFGLGTFNQRGASEHNVTGNLVVGEGPGLLEQGNGPDQPSPSGQVREGIYTLSGGLLSVTGNSIIGAGNDYWDNEPGGKGTFTQTAGSHHTVGGDLIIGQAGDKGNGTGTYNLSNGILDVAGSVNNGSKGKLDIMTEGYLTAVNINNNGTVIANGVVTIDDVAGKFTNFGTGTLSGNGKIIGDLVNSGTVAPGNSPGKLTVDGDFTQNPSGKLIFEIGGYDQGTSYDYLHITGIATLGGSLEVDLLELVLGGGNYFDPNAGSNFKILVADGGLGGTFDSNNYILPALSAGKTWDVIYNSNDVTLHVNAVPIPASMLLLGTGIAGLFAARRKKNA